MTKLREILNKLLDLRFNKSLDDLPPIPKPLRKHFQLNEYTLYYTLIELLRVIEMRLFRTNCQKPSCSDCYQSHMEEREALNQLINSLDEILPPKPKLKGETLKETTSTVRVSEKNDGVETPISSYSSSDSMWETSWKTDLEEALVSYGKTLYPFSAESQMIRQLENINERLREVGDKLIELERKRNE